VISFEKKNSSNLTLHKNINWHPISYHKTPPILGTLWDLNLLSKLTAQLIKQFQIDVVHCRSYITSLIGLEAKKKYGLKFIFDMRGFWADERIEGGIWDIKNPIFKLIYKYFKRREREFIQEADHIVSLTESAKLEIRSNEFLAGNRKDLDKVISVIPTCVDTAHFNFEIISKNKQDELRNELQIEQDEYILLYLGSVGTWYILEEMLSFFIQLKLQKPKCRFLFITTENSLLILNQYKLLCNSKNINFNKDDLIISKAERKDVPLYISICSSSIFFIKPTYSKKASSATKMAEIIAMGKPIITNTKWGDIEQQIGSDIGIIIPDFSDHCYNKVIAELLDKIWDPATIRTKALMQYNLHNGISAYNSIYQLL
jgi:glycosyltransferase involved in cell wall biosynthesis